MENKINNEYLSWQVKLIQELKEEIKEEMNGGKK